MGLFCQYISYKCLQLNGRPPPMEDVNVLNAKHLEFCWLFWGDMAIWKVWMGGGYLIQKTLRGCATNMGSKISLLVYEWPLIKCKIWYMNGSIFQNWLKFKKILEKIGNFVQNLAQNWANWYVNGLLFLVKLVFVWVYFQIPWWHIPTKTKLE